MSSPHKRLIHELVDKSRDRVAHVRAGQCLAAVLDHEAPPSSMVLPAAVRGPHAALTRRALVYDNVSDERSHRARLRKRAAVVAQPAATNHSPVSSYQQYSQYVGGKLPQVETVHGHDRRKAIAKSSKKMNKLAALARDAEAAAAQSEDPRETAKVKLLRAIAVMKGHTAFLNAKSLSPAEPSQESPVNAHMAFLEFKQDAADAPNANAIPASVSEMNSTTKQPIRFGDKVCLLSKASNLPLAIGPNGRTIAVANAVNGPHMTFTIVDFRCPSRHDDVLIGEEFWLRVDPSSLEFPPEDEILALVVETQYYLGCPGWIEEVEDASMRGLQTAQLPQIVQSRSAEKYHSHPNHYHHDSFEDSGGADAFKLVAMKASVPSTDYYGDDAATREYSLENNQNIMRLAKWSFSKHLGRRHATKSQSSMKKDDVDADERSLVLNCASVCVKQSDFALEYVPSRGRAVLRGTTTRMEAASRMRTHPPPEERVCAGWQIRLVHRPIHNLESCRQLTADVSSSSSSGSNRPQCLQERQLRNEKESLEWLRKHQEQVKSNARKIHDKGSLAQNARKAYEHVALQSNSKVAQIELEKTLHHREYFQHRFESGFGGRECSPQKKTHLLATSFEPGSGHRAILPRL